MRELPREKILRAGTAEALSNEELIAVILGKGNRKYNVFKLAKLVWKRYRTSLDSISLDELSMFGGMGKVQAMKLLCAFELGKRIYKPELRVRIKKLDNLLLLHSIRELRLSKKEQIVVISLNAQDVVVGEDLISLGTADESLIHPREVFAPAIRLNATTICIVHNHPSGGNEPSEEDLEIKDCILSAGKILKIGIKFFALVYEDKIKKY
ncbi:DNA repair protein RadC [candidate division WOR-3 bacterium]|nr:DNA repair protein RadC [candidate division WOR-3 bacterium]